MPEILESPKIIEMDLYEWTTLQDDGCPNCPEHVAVINLWELWEMPILPPIQPPRYWDFVDKEVFETAKRTIAKHLDAITLGIKK